MYTIKGGVTILPNSDNKEFIEKLNKAGIKVKTPFSAIGFKATNIPKAIDLSTIKFANKIKPKLKKKVKSKK